MMAAYVGDIFVPHSGRPKRLVMLFSSEWYICTLLLSIAGPERVLMKDLAPTT